MNAFFECGKERLMKRIISKVSISILTAILLFGGVFYFHKISVYAFPLMLGQTLYEGNNIDARDSIGNYQVVELDGMRAHLKGKYRIIIGSNRIVFYSSESSKTLISRKKNPKGFRIIKGSGTDENPFILEAIFDSDSDVPGSLPPDEDNELVNIENADYLEPLRTALHIAGEQTDATSVEYTADYALPAEFMQYLIDHKNITLIYTVTYDGAEHTVTIPAGTAKVEDGVEYYGPAWLIATYGENSAQNPSGTYTVQSGDTLSGIAKMFFTTPDALAKKNHLSNPDLIVTGHTLQY